MCWAYYAIQLPTADDLPYVDKSVRSYCLTHGLPFIIVLENMLEPTILQFFYSLIHRSLLLHLRHIQHH